MLLNRSKSIALSKVSEAVALNPKSSQLNRTNLRKNGSKRMLFQRRSLWMNLISTANRVLTVAVRMTSPL